MRPTVLLFCILFSLTLSAQEMFTRSYFLPTGSLMQGAAQFKAKRPAESSMPWARNVATEADTKLFFMEQVNLDFPKGSSITARSFPGGVEVTLHNNERNHERLRFWAYHHNRSSRPIQLSLRLVAFDPERIEELERKQGFPLPEATLVKLWQDGEGKSLYSGGGSITHGNSLRLEMIRELRFPSGTKWDRNKQGEEAEAGMEITFSTRKLGQQIELTPSLGHSSPESLSVLVKPEFSEHVGHNPDSNEDLIPFTPLIEVFRNSSRVTVKNGQVHVAGQSLSQEGEQYLVLLVGARIQDEDGKLLHFPLLKTSEEK